MAKSRINTGSAYQKPKVRLTLVKPILPLPCFLISIPLIREIINPKGIAPKMNPKRKEIKYPANESAVDGIRTKRYIFLYLRYQKNQDCQQNQKRNTRKLSTTKSL